MTRFGLSVAIWPARKHRFLPFFSIRESWPMLNGIGFGSHSAGRVPVYIEKENQQT